MSVAVLAGLLTLCDLVEAILIAAKERGLEVGSKRAGFEGRTVEGPRRPKRCRVISLAVCGDLFAVKVRRKPVVHAADIGVTLSAARDLFEGRLPGGSDRGLQVSERCGLVVDPCTDQVDTFVVCVVDDDLPVGVVWGDDVADPRWFVVVVSREGIQRPVDGDLVDDHGGESTT